jgi:hypothetical protein
LTRFAGAHAVGREIVGASDALIPFGDLTHGALAHAANVAEIRETIAALGRRRVALAVLVRARGARVRALAALGAGTARTRPGVAARTAATRRPAPSAGPAGLALAAFPPAFGPRAPAATAASFAATGAITIVVVAATSRGKQHSAHEQGSPEGAKERILSGAHQRVVKS